MSLNSTPSAERVHIGIFGKRNAGKSSVINAITDQDLAIVSDVKGTTTDPVSKAMELLPLGPVMIIDTPGLDDVGELGKMRVQKSYQVLNKTDIGILVIDGLVGPTPQDNALIEKFKEKKIPYIVVMNKLDLVREKGIELPLEDSPNTMWVSSVTKENIYELKELIAKQAPTDEAKFQIVGDLLDPSDFVVLVVPRDILLTSFSILFARYKGDLEETVRGAKAIETLEDGDTILLSEGCTHHRQCDDIGRVKIPRWIMQHCGKRLNFEFSSGTEFPYDLSKYKMIVHCGGCTLNAREMKYRIKCAQDQNIPITNYGILIAYMQGILHRTVEAFPHIAYLLEEE